MFSDLHKTIASLLLATVMLASHTALAQQPGAPSGSLTDHPEPVSANTAGDTQSDQPTGRSGITSDIVLLLDNSGSMKANDPDLLMVKAVREFIGQLDFNTRLGIVIFDQKVRLSFPLTELSDTSRAEMLASLEQIDYKGLHTNSPDGLERALYELKLYAHDDIERFIIFLTDGIVDSGDKQKDASKLDWMRKELAADAQNNNIRIFGIAFTDSADFQLIQSLAQQTDAEYYRAFAADQLSSVFERIQNTIAATHQAAAEATKPIPPPIEPSSAPPPKPIIVQIPEQAAGTDTKTLYLLYGIAGLLVVAILALLLRGRSGPTPSATPGGAGMPHVKLVDVSGITSTREHLITTPVTQIGRIMGKQTTDVSHIVIPEKSISRHHAVIEYRNHAFWLMDQGSGNGTRLNDVELKEEKRLKHGDRLTFGSLVFEFIEPSMEQSDATVVQVPGNQAIAGTSLDMEDTVLMSSEEPATPADDGDMGTMDFVVDSTPDNPPDEEGDDMTLAEFDRLFADIDVEDKEK